MDIFRRCIRKYNTKTTSFLDSFYVNIYTLNKKDYIKEDTLYKVDINKLKSYVDLLNIEINYNSIEHIILNYTKAEILDENIYLKYMNGRYFIYYLLNTNRYF